MPKSLDPSDLSDAASCGLSSTDAQSLAQYHSEENFIKLHASQLQSIGVPRSLWTKLWNKIYKEVFDADSVFQRAEIIDEDSDGQREESEGAINLVVKEGVGELKSECDVWILPPMWTFNEMGIGALKENEELRDRIGDVVDTKKRVADRKEINDTSSSDDTDDRIVVSEESVCLVLQICEGTTRERAVRTLREKRGDMIETINTLQDEMDKGGRTTSAPSSVLSPPPTVSPSSSTLPRTDVDERCRTLWNRMFSDGLVGVCYTMNPRPPGVTGPVRPEEVSTMYYVLDELGSAIEASNDPNCHLAPLVVVTLGGDILVLMWTTKPLKEGDILSRAHRQTIKKPVEYSSQ